MGLEDIMATLIFSYDDRKKQSVLLTSKKKLNLPADQEAKQQYSIYFMLF
jgi:hypothetical protein